MKRIACLIAALAVALTGCETINGWIGIVGADYRPPLKTGAIRGKVVDRNGNALVGAKVTNGAAVYFTAEENGTVRDDLYDTTKASSDAFNVKHTLTLEKGEFVLTKVAGNGINYVKAEFDGQLSPVIQKYVTAGTFDVSKAVGSQGINVLDEIKIAIDEPVAADSKLIKFVSTNIPDNIVTAASASATLQFNYSKVATFMQAPPGGPGLIIKASRISYQDPDGSGPDTPVGPNDVVRALPAPITVLPGTKTQSGPLAQVDVPITNVNTTFIDYLRNAREMKLQITFFTDTNGTDTVKDRATGEDLSVLLTLKYAQ